MLACIMTFASVGIPSASAQQPAPIRGINVLFSGRDASDPKGIATLLDTLAAMHVNTILLTVPIYIDSPTGNQIAAVHDPTDQHPNGDTPTPEELQAFIEPAVARGFSVWLRPLLDERSLVAEDPNAWRGKLQPANPAEFFAVYTATLTTMMAGATGASWFVIGTEFTSLQDSAYDDGWSGLIADLRALPAMHDVKLAYAENWYTKGYPQFPPWMDDLDGIAIDAYYPLDGLDNDASSQDVATAWEDWTATLRTYRDQFPDKPIIFGEVGISSQALDRSVYETPWQWPVDGATADPALQATYIEGTCAYLRSTTTDGTPLIDGVAWWMASVVPVDDPATSTGFTIIGKPAQQAVTDCFAAWAD